MLAVLVEIRLINKYCLKLMVKKLVIIPTYNEIENIPRLIPAIFEVNENVDILVVDDSSPDGTGNAVNVLKGKYPSVHLLVRPEKQGLGRAYIAGFEWGLKNGYDVLVEMDADFSHRPQDLMRLLVCLEESKADFAVGSRYVPGGKTVNWGLMRKLISRAGSLYAKLILWFNINDWTGGFNAWKKEVLNKIDLSTIKSNGYSFQIELKYRALRNGFKVTEVPIVFEDRNVGQSKMSTKIVMEALYRVWVMRFV